MTQEPIPGEKPEYYTIVRLNADDVAGYLCDYTRGSEHELSMEEAQEIVKGWGIGEIADRVENDLMNFWGDVMEVVVGEYAADHLKEEA